MAHEVFISHSQTDKAVADAVCHRLEAVGIRCWIAPRDVSPGKTWDDAIVEAINASKAAVVIFSAAANASRHVLNEIAAALDAGATVIPFRIEDIRPTGAMRLHLGRVHWLDALTPPLEEHIGKLVESAKRVVDADSHEPVGPAVPPDQTHRAVPRRPPAWTRRLVPGLLSGTILLLVIAVVILALRGRPPPAPLPGDIVFADSDKRELTPDDLANLSCQQLDIARNEIYARHGQKFNRTDLTQYFSKFRWYNPTTFDAPINAIEFINAKTILQTEKERNCR